MPTGWPPGLLQDDSRKLSDWFASRVDARWTVRQVCAEIERKRLMTDKQPDPLKIADELECHNARLDQKAAQLLRTQHAEIERLTACLKWEQNRAERIGTHGPGCEKWGPAHFECALQAIERKDTLLRQALETLENDVQLHCYLPSRQHHLQTVEAITKELSQ